MVQALVFDTHQAGICIYQILMPLRILLPGKSIPILQIFSLPFLH